MKAAVDNSSAGSKRSITECMADALAKSLGVELSDNLSAQEHFKITGVRYRGVTSPGTWLDFGLNTKMAKDLDLNRYFNVA